MNVFVWVVVMLVTFVTSIIVHEQGHNLVLRKWFSSSRVHFNVWPPKIWTGEEWMYERLSGEQLGQVYITGVFFGGLLIFVIAMIVPSVGLLFVPYAFGVEGDLRKWWKVTRDV